jgi:hypothetical protein
MTRIRMLPNKRFEFVRYAHPTRKSKALSLPEDLPVLSRLAAAAASSDSAPRHDRRVGPHHNEHDEAERLVYERAHTCRDHRETQSDSRIPIDLSVRVVVVPAKGQVTSKHSGHTDANEQCREQEGLRLYAVHD